MRAKDKTHFSFLIAFARQLAAALEGDGDDDVAIALASLATSVELLISDSGPADGGDAGGDDDGVDESDASGDDTPLGSALARIAELESALAAVDKPHRLLDGGIPTPGGELVLAGKRRKPSVLKGARRGKK